MCSFWQELKLVALFEEVEELERLPAEAQPSADSPEVTTLKLANSKLQYRIAHLKRVSPSNYCWLCAVMSEVFHCKLFIVYIQQLQQNCSI